MHSVARMLSELFPTPCVSEGAKWWTLRVCTRAQVDLYIETKGAWPVGRDAAACIGLAGMWLLVVPAQTTELSICFRSGPFDGMHATF